MLKREIYFTVEVEEKTDILCGKKIGCASLHVYASRWNSLPSFYYNKPLSEPQFLEDGQALKLERKEQLEKAVEWTIWANLQGYRTQLHADLTARPIHNFAREFVSEFIKWLDTSEETEPASEEKVEAAQQLINQLAQEEPASAYALSIDSRAGLAH